MSNAFNIIDIEHLMISVETHEHAIASFEKLGFRVRGARHLAPMGGTGGGKGGSAAVLFQSETPGAANYLELAYLDKPFASAAMVPILDGVRGAAMVVLVAKGLEALKEAWEDAGIHTHPMVRFPLTDINNPEGDILGEVKVLIPREQKPPFYFNACEYSDNSSFLDADLIKHPNGAQRIVGYRMQVGADQSQALLSRCRAVFSENGDSKDGAVRFNVGGVYLDVVTSAQATSPHLDRVFMRFSDLDLFENHLLSEGIGYRRTDDFIVVDPAYCCGVELAAERS